MSGREFQALADHARSAYLRYSFTKGTAREVRFLVETLGLGPGDRVLDVGCGPGRHTHALRAAGIDTVGLDLSLAFLQAGADGQSGGDGPWVQADARTLPFAGRSFDAVICLCQGGFGLLGGTGEQAALEEMGRVVIAGGRVVVSAFSSYFAVRFLEDSDDFDASAGVNRERATVRNPEGHERDFDLFTTCYTPRELRLMAAGAGLVVDDLWAVGPGDYARRPPDLEHPEWLLFATRRREEPV